MKETIRVRMTITTGTVFAFNIEKRSVDQREVTLYGNYKDISGFKREARKVTGFKQIDVDNIKVESKYFDIAIEEFMKVAKEVDPEKEATEKTPYTGAKRGRKPKAKEDVNIENTKEENNHETSAKEEHKKEVKSKGKSNSKKNTTQNDTKDLEEDVIPF